MAIYLNKSIESVFADLGVIYSRNFYMNLDVKTPSERIKNIIDLICPSTIVTNNQYIGSLEGVLPENVQIINLDQLDQTIPICEESIFAELSLQIDTDPLCIINTSGSTGTPKGVVLNHRSFLILQSGLLINLVLVITKL